MKKRADSDAGNRPGGFDCQGRLRCSDDQIHGEVAAGFDPDAPAQKRHKYPQVSAQFLKPGEAVVENVTGKHLYEPDERKPQNGPYQGGPFNFIDNGGDLIVWLACLTYIIQRGFLTNSGRQTGATSLLVRLDLQLNLQYFFWGNLSGKERKMPNISPVYHPRKPPGIPILPVYRGQFRESGRGL